MGLLVEPERIEGDETLVTHGTVVHHFLVRMFFTTMPAKQKEN
jgi:hypothetical protein